ncbi:hypothetical protein BDZ88DRAFT_452861 [Geranomyces variabilis]|nr:hypothetical protein BDZ88DRAFT_452861 [Geranomyces variabilis]KAJ3138399.1 hypothetical protein HDU90_001363 [Geranomyces variabilis]
MVSMVLTLGLAASRYSDLAVGVVLHNAGVMAALLGSRDSTFAQLKAECRGLLSPSKLDEVARLQAEVELAILRNQLLAAQAEKAETLARAERAAAAFTKR